MALMKGRKPSCLKGFKDFLPRDMAVKLHVIDVFYKISNSFGFNPISTPSLEYASTLLENGSEETDKQIFRFKDHGDRDIAMRFDLTVPFTRFIIENLGKIKLPFRRSQIGNVWRGEKPQKARFREFTQGDLDIIGSNSLYADLDILLCFDKILDNLYDKKYTININNRKILSGIINRFFKNINSKQENLILIALDKLDKIGKNSVSDMLNKILNSDHGLIHEFMKIIYMDLSEESSFDDLKKYITQKSEFDILSEFIANFKSQKNKKSDIKFNLSTVRGLDYYNAMVFEIILDDFKDLGSVCSGGRYDNLANRFIKTNYNLSGVGGSLGIDRFLLSLNNFKKKFKISMIIKSNKFYLYALKISNMIRAKGVICEINLKKDLYAQLKYADINDFDYSIIIGEEEQNTKKVTIKDMLANTEYKLITLENIFKIIKIEN